MSLVQMASLPDSQKLRILEYRQQRKARKEIYECNNIPQRMRGVKRLMLSDYACPVMEEPGITSPNYIARNYNGSQTWFNLAVQITNRWWRGFINTCKYQIKILKACPHAHSTRMKSVKLNVQMIIPHDKQQARELLDEYKVY